MIQPNTLCIQKRKEKEEASYQYPATLILSFHLLLSWAMSSVSRKWFKSCFITSFELFLGCLLTLLHSRTLINSYLLIGAFTFLLFIWLNHQSLFCLIFFSIGAIPVLSLNTLFLTLSFLIWPCIHHIILISDTIYLWIWVFLLD